jgi:hypothetical protein
VTLAIAEGKPHAVSVEAVVEQAEADRIAAGASTGRKLAGGGIWEWLGCRRRPCRRPTPGHRCGGGCSWRTSVAACKPCSLRDRLVETTQTLLVVKNAGHRASCSPSFFGLLVEKNLGEAARFSVAHERGIWKRVVFRLAERWITKWTTQLHEAEARAECCARYGMKMPGRAKTVLSAVVSPSPSAPPS